MKSVFAEYVAGGAEGIMLRRSGSDYELRRSPNLLKYKPTMTFDARVIRHETGKGKYTGLLGALICMAVDPQDGIAETPWGCGTGLTDRDRANPPAVGSIITVSCVGLTDGKIPRFPVFICERIDRSE
jgi:DNA ligase 1